MKKRTENFCSERNCFRTRQHSHPNGHVHVPAVDPFEFYGPDREGFRGFSDNPTVGPRHEGPTFSC